MLLCRNDMAVSGTPSQCVNKPRIFQILYKLIRVYLVTGSYFTWSHNTLAVSPFGPGLPSHVRIAMLRVDLTGGSDDDITRTCASGTCRNRGSGGRKPGFSGPRTRSQRRIGPGAIR